MARYFAFLRAINVGGHVVRMEALRDLFADLGYSNVETFIASGNVIFEAKSAKAAELERRIEKRLEASLGYPVATFLRTGDELAAISRHRPFDDSAILTAGAFCVGFVGQPLASPVHETLMGLQTEIDAFHVHAREIYWLCQKRQSESKITNGQLERKLKLPITFRSTTTIQKLAAKYC
ncbi:MAG TPA: DUF1697 domain-containing protein [Candidatus Sulfopaludibacter sp.]|jgi:uncharacterized protein (DUF1697 family)|nr:DUF1697 domain-containing protein [Candidatus Sulfopaludibacter sp.]